MKRAALLIMLAAFAALGAGCMTQRISAPLV